MPTYMIILVGLLVVQGVMLTLALAALWRTRRLLRKARRRYGLVMRDTAHYKSKSERDSLTDAYNAGAIRQIIEHYIQETDSSCGGFVMLDVDYFKQVNDTMGHQAGDKVLKTVVQTLSSVMRDGDLIGRLGGDEFCVYLPNIGCRRALYEFCNRITRVVEERIKAAVGQQVTISIGGVMVADAENFAALYKRADKALYEAKEHGRNTCCVSA